MEGQQLTKLSIYTSKDIKEICKFWSRNNYFDGITPAKLKIHLLWKYNSQFTTLWIVKKEGRIIGSCGRIETRLVSRGKFICNAPCILHGLHNFHITIIFISTPTFPQYAQHLF